MLFFPLRHQVNRFDVALGLVKTYSSSSFFRRYPQHFVVSHDREKPPFIRETKIITTSQQTRSSTEKHYFFSCSGRTTLSGRSPSGPTKRQRPDEDHAKRHHSYRFRHLSKRTETRAPKIALKKSVRRLPNANKSLPLPHPVSGPRQIGNKTE